MNVKARLKAAIKAFISPSIIQSKIPQKPVIQKLISEPNVVRDNQLLIDKNVLITGAGRNIGRSIALEMAQQGANIFFTDICQEKCTSLEKELSHFQGKSRGFISDISNPKDIDDLYNSLLENKTTIDILVNNVGIQFETIKIKDLDLGEWHKTFNTNVIGPVYLTKLISQMMSSNSIYGSIIFITSIHQEEISRWPSYSSSKASLGMIIKELAVELAASGIRVNGIAPGFVAEDEQKNPLYHEYTPLYQSSINPCYIGRAAVYLASNYFSQFTTGTVLKIDGGLSLCNYRVSQHPVYKG